MNDNSLFANTIDTVIEFIIVIAMCIPGLLCYASVARNIALTTDDSINHDKIATEYASNEDIFSISSFDAFMIGWLMYEKGPQDLDGVVYKIGDEEIDISCESSGYNKSYIQQKMNTYLRPILLLSGDDITERKYRLSIGGDPYRWTIR